jgi:hypothetical protein
MIRLPPQLPTRNPTTMRAATKSGPAASSMGDRDHLSARLREPGGLAK